jgi:hypothetical protein
LRCRGKQRKSFKNILKNQSLKNYHAPKRDDKMILNLRTDLKSLHDEIYKEIKKMICHFKLIRLNQALKASKRSQSKIILQLVSLNHI